MMKQFLKYVILFVSPLILTGVAIEMALRQIPNDYAYKRNYLDKNAENIKVLFLGNSHFYYDINPAYLTSNSFNAAYVSQTWNFDLGILEKYAGKWKNLEYIIIPADYFSFSVNLETTSEDWRVKDYNIYYGIHTTSNPVYNTELFSNKLKNNLQRIYSYYFKHDKSLTCSNVGWGTVFSSKTKQDIAHLGELAAKRHAARGDRFFDQNIQVLHQILAFAEARNIKVLLLSLPVYNTYAANLPPAQLDKTIRVAGEMEKVYKNSSYFNLLNDPDFVYDDYYDGDHLNEIGAEKLTKKVDSLINLCEKRFTQQKQLTKK
ncbi:MAG: hypothetical protein ACTHJ5_10490 [Ilyomonas sp.]